MAKAIGKITGAVEIEGGEMVIRFDREVLVDLVARAALKAFDIMDVAAPTSALKSTSTVNGQRKQRRQKPKAKAAAPAKAAKKKPGKRRNQAEITRKRLATMAAKKAGKTGEAPAGGWPGAEVAAAR